MIKLVRVDHRLIHGQVAMTWTRHVGINSILVVDDEIVNDKLAMNMLRIANPKGVKLIIKNVEESVAALNSGATDKYEMMILCKSIDVAHRLFTQSPMLKELNLGGTKTQEDRKQISKSIHVSPKDIELLKELVDIGTDVSIQMVPNDPKQNIMDLIK